MGAGQEIPNIDQFLKIFFPTETDVSEKLDT
jgi:hypothetical protein